MGVVGSRWALNESWHTKTVNRGAYTHILHLSWRLFRLVAIIIIVLVSLHFLEGSDVDALDVVLKLGDLLLEEVRADLVVLDDRSNDELLDAVSD